MMVMRACGWGLLFLALLVLIGDAYNGFFSTGMFRLTSGGELWFTLDKESLNLTQAVIQRYVSPFLWDPVLQTVLVWPAGLVLGGLGGVLVAGGELVRRRRATKRAAAGHVEISP